MRASFAAGVQGIALAVVLGLAGPPAGAHTTPEELDEAIRAYILENPGVILESVRRYRDEQEAVAAAEQEASQRAFLQANAREVYDDGFSVVLGNPDGDLTLVEFFDYRCGYCRRAIGDVLEFLDADGGIRLVLKEFPILGEESRFAARASIAAAEQDRGSRFLEFHLALLRESGPLSRERVLVLAAETGYDRERLEADLGDAKIDRVIRQNYALAEELGINGTPAFIMGDEVVPGYIGAEQLIDWARKIRAGT